MLDNPRHVRGDLAFGRCMIRPATRQLLVDGQAAAVGARAFDLLVALAERPERIVSKAELLDLVWPGLVVEENNLQVHIWALRKVIGPEAIVTVPGRGYRFGVPVTVSQAAVGAALAPPAAAGVPAAAPATAHAPAHGPASSPTVAPGPAPVPHAAPPTLFGRESDLQALQALLATQRLVTVVGAGGVGKTALVETLVHPWQASGAGEACLVDLAPLTDAAQLVPALAGALQLTLGGGPGLTALVAKLQPRRLLLVLDNCEHLLQAVAEVAEALLQAAPQVQLLATSQEALKLPQEHVHRLGTLALPPVHAPVTLALARGCGALLLFEDRARAADPRFALTEHNIVAVVDICRQLDGIALAIELAAARVPLLGVEGLRLRLGERLRLLTGGARDQLPRHRTLRAALEWSHQLLTPVQQAVFRRLGVMSGSFGVEAAQQVAASADIDAWSVLDALGALVDKSLVTVETTGDGDTRLRLLETMRHYAMSLLVAQGEEAAARERHLACFLALAESAREPLLGPQQGHWLARLDLDRENLFAAHRSCDSAENGAERGLRLAIALVRYWLNRGLLVQGQQVLLEALARPGAEAPSPLRAEGQLRAGWQHAYRGLDREAATLLAQSVATGRACGATALVAEALSRQGYAHIGLNERATARACIEEACALAAQLPQDLALRRLVSANLAEIQRLDGRLAEAEPLYEEGLQFARRSGDRLTTMIALNNLAMVAVATGRGALARTRLLESLAICDELGSRRGRLVVMEVCAGLAAQRALWVQCAHFDGAAEVHTVQMGRRRDVVDAAFLAPWIDRCVEALGAEAFAQARAAGQAMSHDDAIDGMRRWLAQA